MFGSLQPMQMTSAMTNTSRKPDSMLPTKKVQFSGSIALAWFWYGG